MEVFMEPQAKYCEDPTNAGVTGTVVITTSHSSVHVWDYGLVQADLYSCKDFDQDDIGEFIAKLYNCQDWDIQMYDRRPGPRLTALIERNALQAA
jgi:S-adenosylmethionine/arginine decarboxylase-like enzyme